MYKRQFVVWAATGFWHGANWNFILWGLFFFVFLVIEKAGLLSFLNKSKVISHIYVIFLLVISWALFAISDMSLLGSFFGRLFSLNGGSDWIYYLRNYALVFLLGIFCSTPLVEKLYNQFRKVKWLEIAVLAVLLLVSVAYLVDATYNPFLYFNF